MRIYNLLSICALLFSIGCGQTKGYLGPDLPPEQLTAVRFSANGPVSLSNETVDTVGLGTFSSGIDVLPGSHIAALSLAYKVMNYCDPFYCRDTSTRNNNGVITSRQCTCSRECYYNHYAANCNVNFTSRAGETVDITAISSPGSARVTDWHRSSGREPAESTIYANGSSGASSSNECSDFRWSHSDSETESNSATYCPY